MAAVSAVGVPVLLAASVRVARAHDGLPPAPHDLWSAWSWEPAVLAGMLLAGIGYGIGTHRLLRRGGAGRRARRWRAAAFGGGIAALFVALISPLAALGSALFSAHMLQHVVLMMIAAPLLVLGRPLAPWTWALPPGWRRPLTHWMTRRGVRAAGKRLTHPVVAWSLHAVVLWVWHAPILYEATLRSEAVHVAQHASFFAAAMLFWWSLLQPRERGAVAHAIGIPYVFTTAVHSSALGALLAFSPTSWYPAYAPTAAWWGLTGLEDQQLGGLIMWVPAGVVYLGTALGLVATWLRLMERDADRRETLAAVAEGTTRA